MSRAASSGPAQGPSCLTTDTIEVEQRISPAATPIQECKIFGSIHHTHNILNNPITSQEARKALRPVLKFLEQDTSLHKSLDESFNKHDIETIRSLLEGLDHETLNLDGENVSRIDSEN